RRAPARRIAPLVLLGAALAVGGEASALADGFSGTLAITSIVRPSPQGRLAQVLAQASVTPQCDQADCSWQPAVETVAPEQAGGQETLVAQALYAIPARPSPRPGAGPDPGLLRTAIP